MKRLFAYLMAFLMSLKTSTAYTPTPEKDFSFSTYSVETLDPPDYRDYYYGAEGEKVSQLCVLTHFTSNGKRAYPTMDPYWFVDGLAMPDDLTDNISVKDGEMTLSNLFTNNTYIIAPSTCKLKVHSKGSDGKSMTLNCTIADTSYTVGIQNMGGWYCDVSRTGKIENHTGEDQYNTTFRAGQVLGYATNDTTITIKAIVTKNHKDLKNSKSKCAWVNTIEQFYTGGWGVDENDTTTNRESN